MQEEDNQYTFETDPASSRRDEAQAQDDLEKFTRRLGLDPDQVKGVLAERLQDLTVNCHLAIRWYDRKLKVAIQARRGYFILSLSLLALIPVALVGISWFLENYAHSPSTSVTAQLSAVLTGFLAFQRGLSAWLDRRQVVAGYSKASSDLKSVMYSFEQKWDDLSGDPARYAEFLLAIKAASATCKDIVRRETDQYFQTLSYPSIDVGTLLKTSAADAKELAGQFIVAPAPAAAGADDLTQARLDSLQQRLSELDAQLTAARLSSDAAGITRLTPLRDSVVRELRAARVAVAPVAAAQGS